MRLILQTPDEMIIINPYRFGGGAVDPYAALRAAWDAAKPTLLYSAPRETAYRDGDPVTSATEFVSGTYPATQGTASAKPTYVADGIGGRPAFSFDGGDWLQATGFTFTQPNVIVAIAQFIYVSGVSQNIVNSANVSYRNAVGIYGASQWMTFAGTYLTGTTANTSPHLIVAALDGASSNITVDGVVIATGNAGVEGMNGATIGASAGLGATFYGKLCEVALFDTPPTSGQLDAILAAASLYYSIPIS